MVLSSADYDPAVTALCERALVTILGSAGWWGQHLYLVGGLVPRYLTIPPDDRRPPQVGTRDVDLGLALAFSTQTRADYDKLAQCLQRAGFEQSRDDPAFTWSRAEGETVLKVDLLSETDAVAPGESFKPRSNTGSRLQALNARGIDLLVGDHRIVPVTADRLDGQGVSTVAVRVAAPLPFVALKINAFQLRHLPKDAYDIVYTLDNLAPTPDPHPSEAGRVMASSPIARDPFIAESVELLRARFAEPDLDGPGAYAAFMGRSPREEARLRNEAVAIVGEALSAFDTAMSAR
jgi:hypothetical protein